LCGEVCPVQCIKFPSRIESSQSIDSDAPGRARRARRLPPVWQGDDTPYILPWEQGCILCMKCTEVCPTGALRPLSDDIKKSADEIQMGLAVIDRKVCLPWNRRSWCGACYTICPYREKAITVDHQNRPTVHADHCVGCGLCVEICPIKYKAIAIKAPFYPDRGEERPE
jgi:ferredoxin